MNNNYYEEGSIFKNKKTYKLLDLVFNSNIEINDTIILSILNENEMISLNDLNSLLIDLEANLDTSYLFGEKYYNKINYIYDTILSYKESLNKKVK